MHAMVGQDLSLSLSLCDGGGGGGGGPDDVCRWAMRLGA